MTSRPPAAHVRLAPWRRYAHDGALIAGSTALQVGAFLWTYKRHTPALGHVVAAVAASQMVFPLVRLTWRHLRAETPGLAPAPQSLWAQRSHRMVQASAFVCQALWDGVTYGLWFGTLATQLGVATVSGGPLTVGACVLGATCAVAIGVHLVLPAAPKLDLDTEAILTWTKLRAVSWACALRLHIDTDPESESNAAAQRAQQALSAHSSCMMRQSAQALAHAGVWRNELIVGTALGVWQGVRVARGHIGVSGALAGVSLLFPLAHTVFWPLSQWGTRPAAEAQNRWVFTEDKQAHAVGQSAMRLGLAAALWAAKPN